MLDILKPRLLHGTGVCNCHINFNGYHKKPAVWKGRFYSISNF